MLADGLTMPLTKDRHHHYAERMSLDLNLSYSCGTSKSVFQSKHDFDIHITTHGHDNSFTVGGKRKRDFISGDPVSGESRKREIISEYPVSKELLGTEAI